MTTSNASSQGIIDVSVHITLDDHLKRLEVAELAKLPNERNFVPTITELAEVAGITRQAMHNFATNRVKLVNLEVLSVVISELRRRGFSVEVSDLLIAYPSSGVKERSDSSPA
jgi:DNA-binding Xre family transcriptional regulator